MAYYLLDPSDGLFDGLTDEEKCEKLEKLAANGDIKELVNKYQSDLRLLSMDNFNRQFYTDLRIPNKARDLAVLKQDEEGEPLKGAEFALYSDEACSNPVAKGVTDDEGRINFSVKNSGNNAVVNPEGGLSSEVNYALALNRNEQTGELSEKRLWLKETKAPEGYEFNPTVTEVLITNDYLYADAGTRDDGVHIARGLGYLVDTMTRYATEGAIDITLRDIVATGYNYTGALDEQGFPNVKDASAWKKDQAAQPLSLHFGLGNALLDYGLHDGTVPVLKAEEGWYGLGVAQNRDAHNDPSDPYYNESAIDRDLTGTDISALFTGSTVIVYQDELDVPEEEEPPRPGKKDPADKSVLPKTSDAMSLASLLAMLMLLAASAGVVALNGKRKLV